MERQLLYEYEQTVGDILEGLHKDNHAIAVEVLSLPEKIRGFGHVKEQSRVHAKTREEQLMAAFRMRPSVISNTQRSPDIEVVRVPVDGCDS